MYNNIKELLKRKISAAHVRRILGESIYNGISKYVHEFHSEQNISPEDLLIEGLGSGIVYNKKFQEVLILEVLAESYIYQLCNQLGVVFTNNSESRKLILKKNKKKIAIEIIELLGLDPEVYEAEDEVVEEVVEDVLITPDPLKYLSLHDYQKKIKDDIVLNLTNPLP